MTRKRTSAAAAVLALGLLLGACSSNASDPQDVLRDGTSKVNSVSNDGTGTGSANGEDNKNDKGDLNLPGDPRNGGKTEFTDEEMQELPTSREEALAQREAAGPVHFGISADDVPEVPPLVAEEFADSNPENIVMSLLLALDHGAHNMVAQQSPFSEASAASQIAVLEDYLTDRALPEYVDALNSRDRVTAAFHLQPFLPGSGTFILDDGTEVRPKGGENWIVAIGDITMAQTTKNEETGQYLNGAAVTVNKALYIPLDDGTYLLLNANVQFLMVPSLDDDGMWLIDEWNYAQNPATILQELP